LNQSQVKMESLIYNNQIHYFLLLHYKKYHKVQSKEIYVSSYLICNKFVVCGN